MGHNLWLSEDSRYTLGFRVGPRAVDEPAAAEPAAEAPGQRLRAEADRGESLIEKLARQLAVRRA